MDRGQAASLPSLWQCNAPHTPIHCFPMAKRSVAPESHLLGFPLLFQLSKYQPNSSVSNAVRWIGNGYGLLQSHLGGTAPILQCRRVTLCSRSCRRCPMKEHCPVVSLIRASRTKSQNAWIFHTPSNPQHHMIIVCERPSLKLHPDADTLLAGAPRWCGPDRYISSLHTEGIVPARGILATATASIVLPPGHSSFKVLSLRKVSGSGFILCF